MASVWEDESGRPADMELRFKFHLNKLQQALKQESPVGEHEHDQTSFPYTQAGFPRAGGTLSRSWKLGPQFIRLTRDKEGVLIETDVPYAEIVDQGGFIMDVQGQWMHWNQGGEDVFSDERAGFQIEGQHYVERAVDDWFNQVEVDWV